MWLLDAALAGIGVAVLMWGACILLLPELGWQR